MFKCPKCGGKMIPLKKLINLVGDEWQPMRCKRCKFEMDTNKKKREIRG